MEKFKVIAGCVTGARGKVFEQGEKLTAEQLGGEEMAKALVKQNFVKPLKSKKVKAVDLIEAIEKAESVEAVDEILGSDERPSVVEAANNKKEALNAPNEVEHTITEECLELNPELVGKVEVGEVILIVEGTDIKDVVIED